MLRAHPAVGLFATAGLVLGAATPGQAVPADADGAPTRIRVGQADGFSHIAFEGVQPRSARREGDDLVLSFPAADRPNLALLKVDPPRFLRTASLQDTAGSVDLNLVLEPGAQARLGRADGEGYVNLLPGTSGAPSATGNGSPGAHDPVPSDGVVKMHAALDRGSLQLRFDWRAPVGAAVFRRGDAIWIVFDAHARIDLSEAPPGLPQASRMEAAPSATATAIRVIAPPGVVASVASQGASWVVALGRGGRGVQPSFIPLKVQDGGLAAEMAGATGVLRLQDPAVGDQVVVATALGPSKGLTAGRSLIDLDLLPSAQGLALLPKLPDVQVEASRDMVRITRPAGLQLSQGDPNGGRPVAASNLPQPAAMPGLIDSEAWSRVGPGGFLPRYDALLAAASAEGAAGKGAGLQARLGLARFLVGSELAFEAIGVLDLLAKSNPQVLATPEFRGLRGAARVMAGRYKDAQADFSAPSVADDPASALWRGYADARLGDASGARQAFAAGAGALQAFSPAWRARFQIAEGEAALDAGDAIGARLALQRAAALKPAGLDADRLQLASGRLAQADGRRLDALPFYAAAETSAYGGIAAPAALYAVEVQEETGRMSSAEAIAALDSIRFRWRGDGTEVETARALGRLYIAQGRYREALAALKTSAEGSPDLAAAAGAQQDLSKAFHDLFLGGAADGLPPIQAVGLFLDFKGLTPIGEDGDAMVRRLSHRLVDVDLLDQAALLLKYQADNRLDGVAKAEVATDLATIQVMNRQPELALDALNGSRTTLLPSALQSRRRVIQCRALAALGRYDDALEILDTDGSPDAQAARAEVEWKKRDWPEAGKLLEVALGGRFRSARPLSPLEENTLLRCAIAYSLAGDEAGLARLRTRYGPAVDQARAPALLKVALASGQGADVRPDLQGASDDFAVWAAAMKARLLSAGARTA